MSESGGDQEVKSCSCGKGEAGFSTTATAGAFRCRWSDVRAAGGEEGGGEEIARGNGAADAPLNERIEEALAASDPAGLDEAAAALRELLFFVEGR